MRGAALRDRARRSVEALRPGFPGDAGTGLLGPDEAAEEAFATRHATLPCPALDPATRACDLYGSRPLSCRTYGLPVRIGEENLPPCRLCFNGAPPSHVEACRAGIDPDGIEHALLSGMEAGGVPAAQTVVAFALTCDPGTPPVEKRHIG